MMLVMVLIVLCGIAEIGRLAYLMMFQAEHYGVRAKELHERERAIKAKRGILYDRTGKVIAGNVSVSTISVIHNQISDADRVADVLSSELGLSREEVKKKVDKVSLREKIKSNVPKEISDRIREYGLDGVMIDEDYKRYYPYSTLASHVIGFTGADNQGIIGLEVSYDRYLKGLDGAILTLTNARGIEIENAAEDRREPVNGNSLILSLDVNIQQYAEQAAWRVMEQKSAKAARIIVMNPQNGEIYAMANMPEFDLNSPYELTGVSLPGTDSSAGTAADNDDTAGMSGMTTGNAGVAGMSGMTAGNDSTAGMSGMTAGNDGVAGMSGMTAGNADATDISGVVATLGAAGADKSGLSLPTTMEQLNNMWRNPCISDTYEPGSTFKIITAASALEEGVVTLEDTFNCPGYITVEDRRIRCHKAGGHGQETFKQGIMNSCNPVFITIGARLGVDNFYQYLDRYGIMNKTGVDLPGEAGTIFHKKENVGAVELATVSFGQSFQITPLRLMASASSVINGGHTIVPHFGVAVYDEENDKVMKLKYDSKEDVVSKKTSDTMRYLLESVVSEGTGRKAYVEGFHVGAKTGTSEKLPRRSGKYIASCLGFAPANDPKVMALVLVDEPQGVYYGGTIAAPVIAELFNNILPYLNVEKDTKPLSNAPQ